MPHHRIATDVNRLKCVGRVYDGPLEGDVIEHSAEIYQSVYTRRLPVASAYSAAPVPIGAEIHYVIYRWSRAIRAWVWIQS